MAPYYSVFLAISIFSFLSFSKEFKKQQLFFFLAMSFTLILFAGLRGPNVTPDYWNYVQRFEMVPSLWYWLSGEYIYSLTETRMEPAYILYGAFIKIFTDEYIWMFLGSALLSIGIASLYYYKYSPYVFLTLLLFFVHTYFYRDFTQIRAAIAAAISLFLIVQLHNKLYIKALFTILFASLFHLASLSLIIVYLLSFLELTRRKIIIGLLLAFILAKVGISKIFLMLSATIGGYISNTVNLYANSKYAEEISLLDITNIKNLAIMFFILFFWKKLINRVPFFETMALFMFLSTFWRIAFSDFGIIAGRVATFFGIVEVILIPSFILIFKQKVLAAFFIICYALLVLYLNTIKILGPYSLHLLS